MMSINTITTELAARISSENLKADEERKKKAKFKIQIWFRSSRSLHGPIAYSLSFWESGRRLHGGGDEMMLICRRNVGAPQLTPFDRVSTKVLEGQGCNGLIPGGIAEDKGVLVCPHCYAKHEMGQIGDSIFYRTSVDQAAERLAWWWRKLDCSADIYAKYNQNDPRTVMMARNYDARTAREKKGLTIYPLENILKDTLTGSTVESRFKAFITA
jgi:hypothetical protein